MAKTRIQKSELYDTYVESLNNSQAIFIVDTSKMSSNQVTDIKLKMFDLGAAFGVLKNTVFTKAKDASELKSIQFDEMQGQSGAFFIPKETDIAEVAKVIKEFQKNFELMEAKFGLMEGDLITASQIAAIADLPTRDQLLGMTVYVMSAPLRNLMGVMNGATRDLVNVLNAIKEEKEKAG
jgi:large subunit ribosomal protein L10